MWRSQPSNRFRKRYRDIGPELIDRANKGIMALVTSDRPELLGDRKTAQWGEYYTYEIGRSCRIIYTPIYETNIIKFARICSHKEY